ASALLSSIAAFREIPDDTDQAAAARVNRNRILRDGNHRFVLLIEEEVLRHRIGSPGVVPFTAERPMSPMEAFTVFDDERVIIELLSAKVTVTAPSEITLYVRAFE